MIEITFEEFHEQKYSEEPFDLYVMKNGLGDVLYGGITTRDIWGRWFDGVHAHIVWASNRIYAQSEVGQKIMDYMPDSLEWKIQLWTLDDCVSFCEDVLPKRLN